MVTKKLYFLNKNKSFVIFKFVELERYSDNKIIVPRFNEENGFYTTAKRSSLMSKIKTSGSVPEKRVRKFLWDLGIRYRKNFKKLPGAPDIVIPKYRMIIFIDGEFWHGYNWSEKREKIKSNRDFWIPKIERNMQRDIENTQKLREMGWQVFRFWEHEIKKDFNVCVNQILEYIDEKDSCPVN